MIFLDLEKPESQEVLDNIKFNDKMQSRSKKEIDDALARAKRLIAQAKKKKSAK